MHHFVRDEGHHHHGNTLPEYEEGNHDIPEGQYTSNESVGAGMWTYVLVTMLAFGILFPIGLMMGLARHRYFIPMQIVAAATAVVGMVFGLTHGGRRYSPNNIALIWGWVLMVLAGIQVFFAVFLQIPLRTREGELEENSVLRRYPFFYRVRNVLSKCLLVLACFLPIASWVQFGFIFITMFGWCHEDHLGQCLAHGIMGSSFIAYGCILTIMLLLGEAWLQRRNVSQEFYDSTIIMLWGIVNTFTEHRWGQPWSHGDYQHTSMGIIWWCAGLVGILLSRKRWVAGSPPMRNHIPSIVLMFTGYAMSEHAQHLEVSTKVHSFFGWALILSGLTRIIEISFVLKDGPSKLAVAKAWQFLPPFLLVESGICFMGATEEQMAYLNDAGIDHSSYLLTLSSAAFLVYFVILANIMLYKYLSGTQLTSRDSHRGQHVPLATEEEELGLNDEEADKFEIDDEEDPSEGSSSGRRDDGFELSLLRGK